MVRLFPNRKTTCWLFSYPHLKQKKEYLQIGSTPNFSQLFQHAMHTFQQNQAQDDINHPKMFLISPLNQHPQPHPVRGRNHANRRNQQLGQKQNHKRGAVLSNVADQRGNSQQIDLHIHKL